MVFRARGTEAHLLLAVGIVATGLGLAAIGFGIWASAFATTTYGPAAVDRWAGPWFLAAPPLAILGVGCLARAWWLRRLVVEVSDRGLRMQRGLHFETMVWDSVQEIRTRSARRAEVVYGALEIRSDQGRRLRFHRSLVDLDRLVELVKRQALPGLLEAYRLRFNRGETLSVGVLKLDPKGLQSGRKRIQWTEVRSVDVRAGWLEITAREPAETRIRISADGMPNIDVVVQLVRLLGQVT